MSDRPLSPHLQVYKPQLTSMTSILHRVTGIVLSLGALMVVYYLVSVSLGPGTHANAQALVDHWLGQVVFWGMVASIYYHLANGVRHLGWDAGWGLELESAYLSGWAVITFSVLATALTWWILIGGVA